MARLLKREPDKRKRVGTVLTDYGVESEEARSQFEQLKSLKGGAFKDLDVEGKMEQYSRVNIPTLMADESAISKKKRKKTAASRLRGGRLSTILDETLG